MSAFRQFLTSFRVMGEPEPGLFQKPDDSVWLRAADGSESQVLPNGGSQPIQTVNFPFAFNTPNILTGIQVYVPTPGDFLYLFTMGVSETFDGTTPQANLYSQGEDPDTGAIFQQPLNGLDVAVGNGGHVYVPANSDVGIGYCVDATPIFLNVSDGAGGDPNVPTPMSVGQALLILLVAAAP